MEKVDKEIIQNSKHHFPAGIWLNSSEFRMQVNSQTTTELAVGGEPSTVFHRDMGI